MNRSTLIAIRAPFDGWCQELTDVPDPVFSARMLGDGLAVDPTTTRVLAPCDGEIIALPDSHHAVSLRTREGIEILIHVGIDTVRLAGRGFSAVARLGDRVRAGDELLHLDLDVLARSAKSLITPIVVTSSGARLHRRHAPGAILVGAILFEIDVATVTEDATARGNLQESQLRMPLHHGLHARPAALLVQAIKPLVADVTLHIGTRSANARSAVSLMALGIRHGDAFRIRAVGLDAERCREAIETALENARRTEDARESAPTPAPAPSARPAPASAPSARPIDGALAGVIAAPGYAMGRATRVTRRTIEIVQHGRGATLEASRLTGASSRLRASLALAANTGAAARREIAAAHLEFLDDPVLDEDARRSIEEGFSAEYAWHSAIRAQTAALGKLSDPRFRERMADLLDLESQMLEALALDTFEFGAVGGASGVPSPGIAADITDAVLLADDLLPSQLTAIDPTQLQAVCLARGGATSHVAIIAAAMGLPMLIGLGEELATIDEGVPLIVDAESGRLLIAPEPARIAEATARIARTRTRQSAERAAATEPGMTADGTRIEVFANLGSLADAHAALAQGAEGCGLLRTEFLFIDRQTAPSESEQFETYQAIAEALGDRPMILRLMDVGGDKPLAYLPLPHEDNPALGLRGIRMALARPDLLATQLRAALRVQPRGRVRLLVPMVTECADIHAVRAAIAALGPEFAGPVELGAMIETPAAAVSASSLLTLVDFLSIGSNDLTQYTLAMDRGHADLAARADALHPAVLRLIAITSSAGATARKLVAVCGGMAADPCAVPLLLGLGVRELSVVPSAVPKLKRQIRTLDLEDCRRLAARCLELDSAGAVRDLVRARHAGDAP